MVNTERLCMGCMNDNGGDEVCQICGYDSTVQNHKECLRTRAVIKDRYVVGKALSVNGEGISYIGWDNANDTIITVKEYFPIGCAHRNADSTVSIIDGNQYTFNEGLLEFLEINRKLMGEELPAIVQVLDVFEENGTAFAILQNIQGITLRDFLTRNGGTLKWEQARALLLPLIDTIKKINDIGIIHKGISVDTILVGRDGKLRLTGFGINKLRIANENIEAELAEGFAAVEQYGIENTQVDTYTDVYGFCATLFNVLIGTVPPKSTLRLENESMSISAKFAEELPRHVLAALANGLQVRPEDRTKDIETLKNELVYGEIAEAPTPVKEKSVNKKEKNKKTKSSAKYVALSAIVTALVFLGVAAILVFTVFKEDVFGTKSAPSEQSSSVSAPVVESIGTVDSNAAESVKLYGVPDFKGKTYAEIIDNEDNEKFEIVIKDKAFSDSYAKGTVCKQSVKAGSQVERDTKIEVVISLGPKNIKMANVVGLDEQSAKLELLKQGFLYENIEVLEKYDEESEPGVVLEQFPKYSQSVSADVAVQIYINTYEGEKPMDDLGF